MSKRSRVHPPYKTKYRVRNWAEYERGLAARGSLTFWISPTAIRAWEAKPTGRPGAQPRYSDLAIETVLTLRMTFRLPLRQSEGFTRSLFSLMDLDLEVSDHTTLSRRARSLRIAPFRIPADDPLVLILDSTGLSITGKGQWAAAKHGERGARGWRKLHLAVDGREQILHHELTSSGGDDAHQGVRAIEAVRGELAYVVADAAYDSRAIYDAAEGRGARTVIRPTRNASLAKARSPSRRKALQAIAAMARNWWKARSG